MTIQRGLIIALIILGLGLVYRLILTSQGHFLFNMDNARDFVDVREMVELRKMRLIGPTSGIEGLFTGPGWYYLLIIPYLLGQGDPYAAVLLMIALWLIGGLFVIGLLRNRGWLAVIAGVLMWSSAPYLVLATMYSLNPNPVELLAPVFVWCWWRYLLTSQRRYSLLGWGLGGVMFNFEMAAALFVPLIIWLTMILAKRWSYFKSIDMWLGIGLMSLFGLPQLVFELKHNFFMTQSLLNHLGNGSEGISTSWRMELVSQMYQQVLSGTLLNNKWLVTGFLASTVGLLIWLGRRRQVLDPLLAVILATIFGPLLGHLLIPVKVMPWHLGFWVAGIVLLLGYLFGQLQKNALTRLLGGTLVGVLVIICLISLDLNRYIFNRQPSDDPSIFANQIAAIDRVYELANGQQFKVYVYLPSVIDYSYQYLFWWYGAKKYGYLPLDYAYAPNKPPYISQKELLPVHHLQKVDRGDSGLVFLIKEPDEWRRRELWENQFKSLPLVQSQSVGPIIVEQRLENKNEPSK